MKITLPSTKSPRYRLLFSVVLLLSLLPLAYYITTRPRTTRANWYDDSWGFRKQITIDHTKVAGSSDHTDFPVLLSLASDTDLAAKAQIDGDDILLADADGNKLDHEIEKYDYTTGQLIAWVRVPTLSYDTNTTIYLYYGHTTAENQENITGVWDTDYVLVQHLEETTTGNTDFLDSSSKAHHSSTVVIDGVGSNADATGQIGSAVQFDGSNDSINFTTHADYDITAAESFTLSYWMKSEFSDTRDVINKGGAPGWRTRATAENEVFAQIRDGTVNQGTPDSYGTHQDGLWHYIVIVRNVSADTLSITYDNLSPASTADMTTASMANATDLRFGAGVYDGTLDEVRFSTTPRSTDWNLTEYNNQSSPSTFYTLFSEETADSDDPPVAHWKFDEGVDNTCSGGTADACDDSGNANDLTKDGGSWVTEDKCIFGKCYQGSGDAEYLYRADDADFDFAASDAFTITGWFRHGPISGSLDALVTKYQATTGAGYKIYMDSDGDLVFGIDDDGTWDTTDIIGGSLSKNFDDNRWHHFAAIKRGTIGIYLYVDGTLIASDTSLSETGTLANGGMFEVGVDSQEGATRSWEGFIDDLKVYRYARTPAQLRVDYAGGAAVLGITDQDYLSHGLAGYWPLNHASGNATDTSGNSTTLTNNNTTPFTGGKFGTAPEFNGTTQYFEAADNTALSLTGDLTLAAWINPDDTTNQQNIVGKWDGTNNSYLLALTGDELVMYIGSASDYQTTTATNLSANTYSHVAGVYTAATGTVRLFVNGIEQASTPAGTLPASIADDAGEFVIGADDSPANYFDGYIDEVRVYNRALAPNEIEGVYRWVPGPVAYYPLDENTGTTTVYDRSANGVNLTMTNLEEEDWTPGKYGSALTFDGTNEALTLATANDVQVDFNGSEAFTISTWVYISTMPAAGNNSALVAKWDATSSQRGYTLNIYNDDGNTSGVFSATIADQSTGAIIYAEPSTETIYPNIWYHVTMTFNGGTAGAAGDLKLYVNDTQVAQNESTPTFLGLEDVTADFTIGDYDTNDVTAANAALAGKIDDVRVYNYVRTLPQITQDRNAGHPTGGSPIGSQLGYWSLDDIDWTEGYIYSQTPGQAYFNISSASTYPTLTANGRLNNALEFTAASSQKVMTNVEPTWGVVVTGDLTLSLWVKPDSVTGSQTLAAHWSSTAESYALDLEGDEVRMYIDSVSSYETTTTANLQTGTWYHLAGVYSAASQTVTIYVNGIPQTSTTTGTIPASIGTDNLGLTLGSRHVSGVYGNFFDGTLDEVKVYSAALTPDQVKIDALFGTGVNFSAGQKEAEDLTGGAGNPPIIYYPFNENAGTSSLNDKISGISASLNGSMAATAWVPGYAGSALKLDGSNDYLSLGDITQTDNLSQLTISTWVKIAAAPDTGRSASVASKYDWVNTGGGQKQFLLSIGSTLNAGFCVSADGSTDSCNSGGSPATLPTNEWVHLVATYNGSQLTTYVNGVWDRSTNYSSGIKATTTEILTIGRRRSDTPSYDAYFNGAIDEWKIFDYALSPAQIAYEYNRGKPIGHWKLDDCTGTAANDASGKANHGTITIGASGTYSSAGTCDGASGQAWYAGRSGKFGSSLAFDGSDDKISVGDIAAYSFEYHRPFSLAGWLKTSSDAAMSIIAKQDSSSPYSGYNFQTGFGGYLYLQLVNDYSTAKLEVRNTTGVNYYDNAWHFVTATYDGSGNATGIALYFDGTSLPLTSTGDSTLSSTIDNAISLHLGSRNGSAQLFTGLLDDLRLYNYQLTAAQVLQIMNEDAAVRYGP